MIALLADKIADGYWTLCTPQEAVEAFLSEATQTGWAHYDEDLDREPTNDEMDAAIGLFIRRALGYSA